MMPVILLMVNPEPEILFDPLVRSFRLSIGPWVVGSGDVLRDPQESAEFLHEFRCESGVSITDHFGGESKSREYLS